MPGVVDRFSGEADSTMILPQLIKSGRLICPAVSLREVIDGGMEEQAVIDVEGTAMMCDLLRTCIEKWSSC